MNDGHGPLNASSLKQARQAVGKNPPRQTSMRDLGKQKVRTLVQRDFNLASGDRPA
jgi:hypothetical protein